ncbi:MAG: long-chain fatty acid--CoA ligase [Pelagibacterales bacterium]|nr:long-chain fatty acid--CoA ligase [Pelagibacterales bacterium]OUU62678.1 MAG: hypothetical protein CBC22_03345 [Alphaproteobacteria bacterium TMED62]|tara:strand:- start:7178 stop:8725 length:1548 start_codon:yes stop_codon:yes gene_type:complete
MLTFDDIIDSFSRVNPKKIVIADDRRFLSYYDLQRNGYNLAAFLNKQKIVKGDRVAFLAYNRVEFAEILYATAKLGVIVMPINYRLSKEEILDIIKDANPKFFLFDKSFLKIKNHLVKKFFINKNITLCIDSKFYHNVITTLKANKLYRLKKSIKTDRWSIMYTSGTTGMPKGVIRDHNGYYYLSAITSIELKIKKSDKALLVMPLFHANSFNFFCAYIFSGASVFIYSKKSFDSKYFFYVLNKFKCTFTSLVPTHFIIILDYLKKINKNNIINREFNFMISSAPVRKDTKKSILKFFKSANLFELYGSSESGWVTMLHPDEQFSNLGTVGKECIGSKAIKIMNEKLEEVSDGTIGELYASTPYNFLGYWKNKKKTDDAFFKDFVSVGDLAFRDKNGYIVLVDRKTNMIISGGENIYPSEVENILGNHNFIKDVAIVGYPDKKWGEIVCAFVVLHQGFEISEFNLIEWSKKRLARYKCPKRVFFIDNNDMPRNASGKILHKNLKEKVYNLISYNE